MKAAVLLVGHGSLTKGFDAAMKKVARDLRKSGRFGAVGCAYLEITRPLIPAGIDRLIRKGVADIVVLPYFVLSGKHVTRHIPEIVNRLGKKYKNKVKIRLAPYLGYDGGIVAAVKRRIREAL
ncbi:MAG: CbiX/SirB N-terminal domain-containing protein [Candidatus Omnitrophica bacterium]|nr:CbiX/SirB N-terminal domain-containing protein [Candidatus Omnitrophota bacterium]